MDEGLCLLVNPIVKRLVGDLREHVAACQAENSSLVEARRALEAELLDLMGIVRRQAEEIRVLQAQLAANGGDQ